MEITDYQNVISMHEIRKLPISMTTTAVNLTGSWRFARPVFKEKISPCSVGCPASTNIPKYIFYILKNDLIRAANILREENPFPATCGRVCPHFCQFKCNRDQYDGSVQIREIEKFIGDYALNIPYDRPKRKVNKKVAIIGGGPAGLSCAYFLSKNGYSVSVYEREGFLGGLLMYGIPSYRLPRSVVDREIANIIDIGNIEVNLNQDVDNDKLDELSKNYDAVFFSVGLNSDRIPENMAVDGDRVLSGYEFLKKLNTSLEFGEKFRGERIAVVGGGNVAFDVARTLLRLGCEVEIIYRRTLKEAPAFEDEKKEGLQEGIKLKERSVIWQIEKEESLNLTLRDVISVTEEGMQLGEIKGIERVDRVVVATGQKREFEVKANSNVFIGGDYAYGARTVIEAIASGKRHAFKIMEFLGDKHDGIAQREEDMFFRSKKDFDEYNIVTFDSINLFYFDRKEPLKIGKVKAKERVKSFDEINLKPSLDKILDEAKRCFSCGVCNRCGTCWFFCPDVCITVGEDVDFDYEYCKGCGVCSVECPRGIIDMVEDK